MESTCKEKAVVAMDFGTSFSSYAYSFTSEYKTDPTKISCFTKWPTGTAHSSLKTPTVILLWRDNADDEYEFYKFGYAAENRYAELVENNEHDKFVLVDRFKMDLYSEAANSKLQRNTTVLLKNGEKIKAIALIKMSIKYLKDHFFQSMENRNLKLKVPDVRWVLTVPAIWTDGAKQLMREAAQEAGIPSSNLTVAFEPEAAALTCLHLTDPTKADQRALMKSGTPYLVLDAGGGTVDFTVYEVSDSGAIVLKHEASGGPWGGAVVNQNFLAMLIDADLGGQQMFEQFAETNREDLIELERVFEYKKRTLQENQSFINLKIPQSLSKIYQNVRNAPIDTAKSTKYGDQIKIVGDKIRIETQLVRKLFDNPCESIIDHTKRLLRKEECRGVNTILLVGGFGGSDVVQRAVQESFPRRHVIIPEDPELAVVKGAVLYGHNPLMVKTRIARYTYGTDVCREFEEGKHPKGKKVYQDGLANCRDLFDVHVTKGEELRAGQPQGKQRYTPSIADQTEMLFKIFASTEKNPTFVTDDSCTYIGELKIAVPDTTGGRDRVAFCQMSFGDTEMVVTATEKKTGNEVSATLNFLG